MYISSLQIYVCVKFTQWFTHVPNLVPKLPCLEWIDSFGIPPDSGVQLFSKISSKKYVITLVLEAILGMLLNYRAQHLPHVDTALSRYAKHGSKKYDCHN